MKIAQPPARRRATAVLSAVASLTLTQLVLPHEAAVAATGPVVVASGLDNPRGLVFGAGKALYVGEAGHAGPLCLGAPGELGPTCVGFTSRISVLNVGTGARRTVVKNLPSIGTAVASTGIDGVAINDGRVAGIMTGAPQGAPPDACTGSTDPTCAATVAAVNKRVGDLFVVNSRHQARTLAEVGTIDYQYIVDNKATLDPANPDFRPGDANPYGITAAPGDGWYITDAGSNTLDRVDRNGTVHVLAYFPNPPGPADQRFPYDAVPTCVATSGRAVWVGTLSGQVYRYSGGHMTLVADRSDGLTAVNGCATDRAGNLYASNIFGVDANTFFAPHSGKVSKITPGGTVTTVAGSEGLSFPSGVAINGGKLYVATNSICPSDLALVGPNDPPVCDATGQVVRLAL